MKLIIFSFTIILISFFLTGCFEGGPDICNPKLNVSKEAVVNDFEANRQDYQNIVNFILNTDVVIIEIVIDNGENDITIFNGSKIDYLLGNINNDDFIIYDLKTYDGIDNDDKKLLNDFIINRKIKLLNVLRDNNEIGFNFYGLTSINYKDGEFSYITNRCPNG